MISRGGLFFLLLFAAFYASQDFLFSFDLKNLKQKIAYATDPDLFHTRSVTEDFEALLHDSNQLIDIKQRSPEAWYLRGKISLMLALSSPDRDTSISYLCAARDSFKAASSRSPRNQHYHVAWADTDIQLGQPELLCGEKNKTLDAKERLDWALSLAPHNTTDLYLAALAYLSTGDKTKALKLFRSLQEINPNFNVRQREYVFRQVTSEEEFKTAAPAKFPEIVHWTVHFSNERPHDYFAWRPAFTEKTLQAIDELEQRVRENKLALEDFSTFIKLISTLPTTSSSEKLRVKLDTVLARIFATEGNTDWAQVLKRRTDLARIPALKTLIADDKVPSKTMLFGWVTDNDPRTASLDSVGHSLGVYLPRSYQAELLILESSSSGSRVGEKDIRVLFSHDNLEYFPLEIKDRVEELLVDGNKRLAIDLGSINHRFLKIRYRGSNRKPRFTHQMNSLVQVYGRRLS